MRWGFFFFCIFSYGKMDILDVTYLYVLRKLKVIFLIIFSDCRLGNRRKLNLPTLLPPRHIIVNILIFMLSNFVSVPVCVSGCG